MILCDLRGIFAKPVLVGYLETKTGWQICPITIEGHQFTVLFGSGSLVTLVRASLVDPELGSGRM